MWRVFVLISVVSLAGCVGVPIARVDTARLAPGQLGTGFDPDVTAINFAQWAFADPGRTRGRPVEGARGAAAMDYIAGALNTSPRWSNIPATTQLQLLQGRREVRRALGVVLGTPSQAVVDRLTMAADALAHQDEPAALRQLGAPVFDAPAQTVLYRLANLPYLQMANVSTMHAANALFRPDDSDWR